MKKLRSKMAVSLTALPNVAQRFLQSSLQPSHLDIQRILLRPDLGNSFSIDDCQGPFYGITYLL
jgi:hypothetical protein